MHNRRHFSLTPRAVVVVLALALSIATGIGMAVGSSPASLRGRAANTHAAASGSRTPSPVLASPTSPPTPIATPTATVGVLGGSANLAALTPSILLASGDGVQMLSTDAGKTWSAVKGPPGSTTVVLDPQDPKHLIAGGPTIRFTTDGGANWRGASVQPTQPGPYVPILISPADPSVWFVRGSRGLLRTRDGGQSWRELATLPAGAFAVLVPGRVAGQFFVASGGQVLELNDNGQQIVDRGSLPGQNLVAGLAAASGSPNLLLARAVGSGVFTGPGGGWTPATSKLTGPVAITGTQLLIGNGGARLGTPGAIDFSSDGGATWTPATGLPRDQTVEAISALSGPAGAVFAYCYAGDLYQSIDSGHAWTLISTSLRSAP